MSGLQRFILRVLVWLPICFGAWYFLSILFVVPLAASIDALMTGLFPALIERVGPSGNQLEVITHLAVTVPAAHGTATGDVVFTLNPLAYGYCVPLYTALVLATPGDDGVRALRWLVGMLMLFGVQLFGVATALLKVLAFQMHADARAMLGFAPWGYELLALAYQIGYLILPPVVPLVTWLGQFQDAVAAMTRRSPCEA